MQQIDIHKLADHARFNRFHGGILAWCAIIICDGYDLAVAGIALPAIMKSMGVTAQNAGFMVSSKGARVMDSTPPAISNWASPAMMARAAVPTASMPEPHRRLRVTPATLAGRPASSADMRATLRLSSPA